MRKFTRIAAATVLAGGLTVAGAGTALADPQEGILGHVLSDLLGPHVPGSESFQGGTGSSSDAPEQNTTPGNTTTPGEPMSPAAGTGGTLP